MISQMLLSPGLDDPDHRSEDLGDKITEEIVSISFTDDDMFTVSLDNHVLNSSAPSQVQFAGKVTVVLTTGDDRTRHLRLRQRPGGAQLRHLMQTLVYISVFINNTLEKRI